jgi:phosphogluconate dehydratase
MLKLTQDPQKGAAIEKLSQLKTDGPLSRLRDGDVVRLCGNDGSLDASGSICCPAPPTDPPPSSSGTGRELFAFLRMTADHAEAGGSTMLTAMEAELASPTRIEVLS